MRNQTHLSGRSAGIQASKIGGRSYSITASVFTLSPNKVCVLKAS